MARRRHPKKDVEKALQYAEARGFSVVEVHKGHRWGELIAPNGDPYAIWSTPKNPSQFAKWLQQWVDRKGG